LEHLPGEDYRRALEHKAEIEARAEKLAKKQTV
jgi:hypothetical protein